MMNILQNNPAGLLRAAAAPIPFQETTGTKQQPPVARQVGYVPWFGGRISRKMNRCASPQGWLRHTVMGWMVVLCLSLPAVHAKARQFDVLIVESPDQLVLYNKYEQELSYDERRQLPKFLPIRILDENAFLSDGFTPCIKGEVNREKVYILKDETGELRDLERIGYHHIFRNCRFVDDTVKVVQTGAVFLTKKPTFRNSPDTQKYFLEAGDKLHRLFTWKEWTYIERIGKQREFGWSYLAPGKKNHTWKPVESASPVNNDRFYEITREVERELNEVNLLLEDLYARLNTMRGEHRVPPFWRMEIREDELICYPDHLPGKNKYPRSTRILVNRLRNIVQGTPYRVFHRDDVITIRR